MAPAQGQYSDHSDRVESEDRAEGPSVPPAFLAAVDALRSARLRPELEVEVTRPPQRLAPHAYAMEAAVVDGEDDLADGRLVLLHDPAGHDAWQGAFRLVTLVRAELEPEMAADPLLPEVCWSWLTGALDARGLSYGEAAWDGDTRRIALLRCAVRAPPGDADRDPGLVDAEESRGGVPDTASHLMAWGDLLCQIAGLPPSDPADAAVVTLPQRRGPQV